MEYLPFKLPYGIQVNGYDCFGNLHVVTQKVTLWTEVTTDSTSYHFNVPKAMKKKNEKDLSSCPPPQHVQILSEELCAGNRPRFWRSLASPMQLGFQCRQWKSHTVQQEQPRHSVEGSYPFIALKGIFPILLPLAYSACVFLGVLIRKATNEKQNLFVWQNKASVPQPSSLAALFITCPRRQRRHLLSGHETVGKFILNISKTHTI